MSQTERSTSQTSGTLSVEYCHVVDLHCGPPNRTVSYFLSQDVSNVSVCAAQNNSNSIPNQLKVNICFSADITKCKAILKDVSILI